MGRGVRILDSSYEPRVPVTNGNGQAYQAYSV